MPQAIFASNDHLAIGALEALRAGGIPRVPEGVALIGFDDMDVSRHLGLTSVNVPLTDIGRRAAESAICLLEEKPTEASIVLQTGLIKRRSCG